jgi:hypothetical protein
MQYHQPGYTSRAFAFISNYRYICMSNYLYIC